VSLRVSDFEPLMELRPLAGGFEVNTIATPHGAIFGTYLLFQQVLIAERAAPGKRVLTLQTVFANGGRSGQPAQVAVEKLQEGRSFASLTMTFRQGDTVISRSEVLLTAEEPDYLSHQAVTPTPATRSADSSAPDSIGWPAFDPGHWPGSSRRDPASTLDQVTFRFGLDEPVPDPSVQRALLAVVTEPEVMRAFLEFASVPDAPPGRMPGNVLSQTVNFLAPVDDLDGLIMAVVPTYAGRGRAHGEGRIFSPTGALLATFSTIGVLRAPRAN
jgi:acyl-CoA thioesterase-2